MEIAGDNEALPVGITHDAAINARTCAMLMDTVGDRKLRVLTILPITRF